MLRRHGDDGSYLVSHFHDPESYGLSIRLSLVRREGGGGREKGVEREKRGGRGVGRERREDRRIREGQLVGREL